MCQVGIFCLAVWHTRFMNELDVFSQVIADILRALAMERGFSQSSLSQKSGVSQAQISRIFSHKRSVSIEDLSLISAALGSSASEVVRSAEDRLAAATPSFKVVSGPAGSSSVDDEPLPDFSKLAARTVKNRPQWDAANSSQDVD